MRVDICFGLFAAAALLLAPGLAIVAMVALFTVLISLVSMAFDRWRSRRQ